MRKSETAKLLTFARSVQGGEVTEVDVEAWHELIGGLVYEEAMRAVRDHFEHETRRLWPADLLHPQRRFDPDAHYAWLRSVGSDPEEWAELCGWHDEREARQILEERGVAA